jgi:hypothetical protein
MISIVLVIVMCIILAHKFGLYPPTAEALMYGIIQLQNKIKGKSVVHRV